MANLQYSLGARNVLNRFHSVEKMIYVEGDDDIPFWEIVINSIGEFSYKIEESGGKPQLSDRILEIQGGGADFLVAIDSDFDDFLSGRLNAKIIKTFGYSIENSIVSDVVLHKAVCNISKISKKSFSVDECKEWVELIDDAISKLVLYDISNRVDSHGVAVIGENCDRFMISKKSCALCGDKINEHISTFPFCVSEDAGLIFLQAFEKRNLKNIDMLRGHFLMSLAFRFVKSKVAKFKGEISISREAFYGVMATCFEASFVKDHPHRNFYEESIREAFN